MSENNKDMIQACDVIRTPIMTEKSQKNLEISNQVSFEVLKSATKTQIKKAVQTLFGVDVISVNTFIRKGKQKTFKGKVGQQSDRKIALVRLKDDQRIDLEEGGNN